MKLSPDGDFVLSPLPESPFGCSISRTIQMIDPPEAYKMAVGAARAVESGDYRRAVLDAATVAEVILRPALYEALSDKVGARAARTILRAMSAFSAQVKLAKELGFDLPSNLEPQLLHVRNATVHSDHKPSSSEANQAVLLCHAALRALEPLDMSLI